MNIKCYKDASCKHTHKQKQNRTIWTKKSRLEYNEISKHESEPQSEEYSFKSR